MLGTRDGAATIAVKNIEVAEKFYRDTLGLKPAGAEEPGVREFRSGESAIPVYESQYAGTNKATAVTWVVGDAVEEIASTLKAKGVVFEHYEMPNITLKGDVHVMGKMRMAWFKDPDGNILSVAQAPKTTVATRPA